MKILLGSNSPRRKELLLQMGVKFKIVNIVCNEDFDSTLPGVEVAEFLAVKKSRAYDNLRGKELLITADTTVLIGDEILNKPADAEEGRAMLQKLSDKQHRVITGVCLRTSKLMESFRVETKVNVNTLTTENIDYYIKNYQPFDKAGSYGIQEWFGLTQISSISGCYYNVVGLPCNELFKRLTSFNG